jgi:SHS2 domain-containing protein
MNGRKAGCREVEHTADWELEVWAPDLAGLLEQAACGMFQLAGLRLQPGPRLTRSLLVDASDRETLLVQFLSELLYLSEGEGIGFDQYRITLDGFHLQVEAGGAPLASIDKEIKAVTYHRLAVRQAGGVYRVNIVFDV